ncbi:hypothetical protein N7478_001802 [Penicillium angulare]|uniref:uncharacterized protein n=1 Tax=Penicillium angulare TaxID=116970 RepID=UPI002540E5A2|nr:uncharacterized protein N7478_001802 [Penicillium angulare]KAJ5288772.1 hypothetical protein N7478_001802 [Penicillium angulare]
MNQKDEPGTSKDMYHYGLQLYNSAIEHMSHQLNRKRKIYSDALIYTIALFQILVMQSLSPIQSNGPNDVAAPNDGFSYTIPPEEYQPIDELFEIMSAMAPLLNAVETINMSSHETRQKLLFDAIDHRNLLMAWYTKEVEDIGGAPWIGTPISKLPSAEHFFGPSYCFSSLDCARIHVLYWAALSILQGVIGQAWCYTYFTSPSPLNIFNDNEYQQSKFYADEISRAIPFCLSESHRAWGSNITIFSLGQVAKVYLEFQCREEFMWAQEGFKLMGSMGSDFPNRVSELLEYNWRVRDSSSASPSSSQSSPPTDQETPPGYLIEETC